MASKIQSTDKLHPVADNEVADIAALITRAFRAPGWHTEEQLVEEFTMTEDSLRKGLVVNNPPAFILQLKEDSKDGQRRIGSVVLRAVDETQHGWRLGWLAIEPTLQTGGIGKRLLDASEEYAKERGGTSMRLTAMNVRHNLIAWYSRRGYQPTGRTEPFHQDSSRHGAVVAQDELYFVELGKQLL
jgi:ribosomal protein S18 acetylase RimI-like enzyme